MPPRVLHFAAKTVDCGEAMDYEIVQVIFDTEDDPDADEKARATPYLMLSVNFEFNSKVQLEFHDGDDYDGGYGVAEITLRRDRVAVVAKGGPTFDILFDLAEEAFAELRRFLKIIFRRDCFR